MLIVYIYVIVYYTFLTPLGRKKTDRQTEPGKHDDLKRIKRINEYLTYNVNKGEPLAQVVSVGPPVVIPQVLPQVVKNQFLLRFLFNFSANSNVQIHHERSYLPTLP